MRNKCLSAFALFALTLAPVPSWAQLVGTDTVPGTACAAKGSVRMTANATGPGAYILTCNGDSGQWVATINAALPTANEQVANKEYVDIAVAAAGSLTGCTNDEAGLCALQAPRSGADPEFVAGNIRSGTQILGVTGTYVGCSLPPDNFGLTDVLADVMSDEWTNSNIVTMPTIGPGPVAITISGNGTPQYRINGGAWTSAPGTIVTGNTLQLRLISSATEYVTYTATILIGGVSDDWLVRTDSGVCMAAAIGGSCNRGTLKYAGLSSAPGSPRMYTTLADQSAAAQWKTSSGTNDIATDSSNDGLANTNQVANSTTFPAFKLCKDLGMNWYLPAVSEVSVLNVNSTAIGGFNSSIYWTSSEVTTSTANYFLFSGGGGNDTKTSGFRVRCVRR